MCLFLLHSPMTSAVLIALVRNPYRSGCFEADGQKDSESSAAFLLASKCVEPNKWLHIRSEQKQYFGIVSSWWQWKRIGGFKMTYCGQRQVIPKGSIATWLLQAILHDFSPCTCESQVCKPHTAAQISGLNSHKSVQKNPLIWCYFSYVQYSTKPLNIFWQEEALKA